MTDSGLPGTTWCWRCRVEHLGWATECVHCGGELHSTPPPEPSGSEFPASGSGSHGLLEIDLSGMDDGARDLFVLFLDGAGIHYELRGLLLSIAESDEERTRELLETITADTLVEFDPADSVSDTEWSRSMAAMMHPSAIGPPERIGESDTELTQVAGTARRVVAAVLTAIMWGVLIAAIAIPASLVWPSLSEGVAASVLSEVVPVLLDVATVAVWGWTPGMYVVDARVVDEFGDVPGWRSSAVRMAAFAWPTLLAWLASPWPSLDTATRLVTLAWLVGILVSIATHPERRGWHDRLAGTWVVVSPRQRLDRR